MRDAPETGPHAGTPRRRRRGRRAAWAGVLLLVALAAAVAWLGSASGLTWLAARGGLQLQGVQGSAWGGLRVARLAWRDGSTQLDARDLVLRWRPRALLGSEPVVWVSQLAVGELDLRSGVSASPSAASGPPTDLLPPLALRIDRLQVGRLRWRQAPGPWQELGSVQASLHGDAQAWNATLNWQGPWGDLQAHGQLGARAPFALRGELGGELSLQHRTVPLQAALAGTLTSPRVDATARALQARAILQAELHPFASVWLGPASIELQGLDPHRLDAALPHAELALHATWRGVGGDGLQGEFELRNAQPGSLDARRLPLRGAKAMLSLRDGVLHADALHVSLAGGASLDGSVSWPLKGSAELELQAHALDLHAVYARLVATRLQGRLQARIGAGSQILSASLRQPGWTAELRARREGDRIELERAWLQAQGAELRMSGRLDEAARRAFRLDATLRDFQPQRFGDWPQARLNLRLRAQGELEPMQARVALRVQPSHWRSSVFEGSADADVSPRALQRLRAHLRLGDNHLLAQGSLGAPGDTLQLQLQAPALVQFGTGWGGSLRAHATLRGGFSAPSGDVQARARDLRGPHELRLGRLDLDASLDKGLQGALRVAADVVDLQIGDRRLQQLGLQVRGTLREHALRLNLRAAPDLRLRASAHGSWQAGRGWDGSLDTLRNSGSVALRLVAPAQVRIGVDGKFSLRHAAWSSPGGSLDIDSLRRDGGAWSGSGSAQRLDPLYWARRLTADTFGLRSDLRLRATWELHSGPSPLLRLDLQRSSGDIELAGQPAAGLGLSRLSLRLDAADGALHAALDAAGTRLGELQAEAVLPLQRGAQGWGVDARAPWHGGARVNLPDVAWVSAWLPQGARVAGALRGDLRLAGSLDEPRLQGTFAGNGLALELPSLGVDLRGGSVDAVFDGQRLRLRSLVAHDAAGSGTLRAEGSLDLADGLPSGSIEWHLDKLRALDRPGQQLQLSGSGVLQAAHGRLDVDASLQVDKADFEMAGGNAPQLASDVVIVGRAAAPPPAAAPMPVRAQVRLDLGRDFHLGGQGVDARLGGTLALRAVPGQPLQAQGSVAVRSGTYSAYGQQLTLVAGSSVNFSGPVDNPGLNLAARRDNLPVQVGVRVTGTLRAPQVALTSTPVMPDGSILSWLVLGQDPSTVGSDQAALLQTAAAALLSSGQGVPLTSRLAGALGLDQLTLSGQGGLQNSVVTLGKKLSSRLSVSVEQSLAATGALFNVHYTFTKRLSLRLQSGNDNAVDLFYTFRFD